MKVKNRGSTPGTTLSECFLFSTTSMHDGDTTFGG